MQKRAALNEGLSGISTWTVHGLADTEFIWGSAERQNNLNWRLRTGWFGWILSLSSWLKFLRAQLRFQVSSKVGFAQISDQEDYSDDLTAIIPTCTPGPVFTGVPDVLQFPSRAAVVVALLLTPHTGQCEAFRWLLSTLGTCLSQQHWSFSAEGRSCQPDLRVPASAAPCRTRSSTNRVPHAGKGNVAHLVWPRASPLQTSSRVGKTQKGLKGP